MDTLLYRHLYSTTNFIEESLWQMGFPLGPVRRLCVEHLSRGCFYTARGLMLCSFRDFRDEGGWKKKGNESI